MMIFFPNAISSSTCFRESVSKELIVVLSSQSVEKVLSINQKIHQADAEKLQLTLPLGNLLRCFVRVKEYNRCCHHGWLVGEDAALMEHPNVAAWIQGGLGPSAHRGPDIDIPH